MELGSGGVGLWVAYVPHFGGNRAASSEGRVSCEIRLLRPLDQMAMASETDDDVLRWRDEHMAALLADSDTGDLVRKLSVSFLRSIKLVCDHTRGWRNVTIDGQPVTDPAVIAVNAPIPISAGPERERGLIEEVREAIEATLGLTGAALKNCVCSFAGNATATSGPPMDEPTVPSAPAAHDAAPTTASTSAAAATSAS